MNIDPVRPGRGKLSDPEMAAAMGFRIKHRRESLGMTVGELGRSVDAHEKAYCFIYQYEVGNCMPLCSVIPRLCRALQMTPNQLFGWEEMP